MRVRLATRVSCLTSRKSAQLGMLSVKRKSDCRQSELMTGRAHLTLATCATAQAPGWSLSVILYSDVTIPMEWLVTIEGNIHANEEMQCMPGIITGD